MNGEAVKAFVKFAQAVEYDQYGLPIEQTSGRSAIPAMLLGGTLGGATAHFALPSAAAKGYREALQKTVDAMKKNPSQLFSFTDTAPGVSKQLTDVEGNVLKEYLRDRALASNAPNMFAGVASGLAGGYLLNKLLSR